MQQLALGRLGQLKSANQHALRAQTVISAQLIMIIQQLVLLEKSLMLEKHLVQTVQAAHFVRIQQLLLKLVQLTIQMV